MASLTRTGFDALIADAPDAAALATEDAARAEFEAWLGRYFGLGSIGEIYPGLLDGTEDDADYATCSAQVLGLPLHETQWIEIDKITTPDGVVMQAVLWTADDGLCELESCSASGVQVMCLADLAGKLV